MVLMEGQVGRGKVVLAAAAGEARDAARRWPQARRPTKACAVAKMRPSGLLGRLLPTRSGDSVWQLEPAAPRALEGLVVAPAYVVTP